MKNFSSLVIFISILCFLQSCQKEPLIDDEKLKIPERATLSSEAFNSDVISYEGNCTTITMHDPGEPFDFMSPSDKKERA